MILHIDRMQEHSLPKFVLLKDIFLQFSYKAAADIPCVWLASQLPFSPTLPLSSCASSGAPSGSGTKDSQLFNYFESNG